MNDLRKAAEMALKALEYYRSFEDCQPTPASKTIPALRQALAQPVDAVNITPDRVDETAKGEHEPVAWVGFDKDGDRCIAFEQKTLHEDDYPITSPLYIAPPKKEWVGLTRRELDIATLGLEDLGDCYLAIEAKLKEKNS